MTIYTNEFFNKSFSKLESYFKIIPIFFLTYGDFI